MKPSFLISTLSLAFIICVLSTIVMVFLKVEPNQVTFGVITAVVSAYLTMYWTPKPVDKQEQASNEQNIHDLPDNGNIPW